MMPLFALAVQRVRCHESGVPVEICDRVDGRLRAAETLRLTGVLRDGCFVFSRETGRFNGETFWQFLRHLQAASVELGRRAVMISDNAQYHRSNLHLSWRQLQEPQFVLDFLPPYSPELNPIERVWKLTRRLCLHNRYFGFLETVAESVEFQFAKWASPNEALRRLCAIT